MSFQYPHKMSEFKETPFKELPTDKNVLVEVIPELNFVSLFDLPINSRSARYPDQTKSEPLADSLARIVSKQKNASSSIFSTEASGRGGMIPPFVFKTREEKATFTNLYLKGIGITNQTSALTAESSPSNRKKLSEKWQKDGVPVFEPISDEVLGMTIIDDARLDGERSLEMHRLGIRSRLPIATFKILAVPIDGKLVSLEELVDKGWPIKLDEENWPVISCWARRHPLTFRDANWWLMESIPKIGVEAVSQLMIANFRFLQFQNDPEARHLSDKYQKAKDRERYEIEKSYFIWLARKYGQEMKKLKNHGIIHGMLSDQNISLGVEFSDNSDVRFYPDGFNSQSSLGHEFEKDFVLDHILDLRNTIGDGREENMKEKETNRIRQEYEKAYNT